MSARPARVTARRGLGRLLATTGLLAALLAIPAPALADCAVPPPLEVSLKTADLVFVGTVSGIEADGHSATFEVEEIWRGDVPATVQVAGGENPAQPAEDDRTFELGTKYVVIPSLRDGRLVDSLCSGTTPWDDSYAAIRPVDARPATASAPPTETGGQSSLLAGLGDLAMPALTVLVIGTLLVVTVVVAGRRRDA